MTLQNLRKIYVDELIKHATKDKRIVCLDSDSRESSLLEKFTHTFPERSFTFGIAEQNMVCAAGGMATFGLIPFVNSYGMFIAMRSLDQLRNSIAYSNLNVKFILTHRGLDSGADGVTHQLTEDISIFRTIPNLTVLQPADSIEMKQMITFSIKKQGPVIINAGKTPVPDIYDETFTWKYGEPSIIKKGEKVGIIGTGIMLQKAINARKIISEKLGFEPMVINLSSMTDVKENVLIDIVSDCDLLVTVEDHSSSGGLGGLISEIMSSNLPKKIIRVGLQNTFAECGNPDQLYRKYNMDEEFIVKTITNNL